MLCHALSGSGHMAGFRRKDTDMQLLTLIVLIMSAVLLSALISPYIPKVSLPLVQIALGVIWYFLPFTPNLNLDDELYMILFIAPLLFFEAKGFPLSSLRRTISISLSLAIGLVLFSVVATGFSLHALWGTISLPAAMALGAALGPTDAVAVSELRKEANLSDSQVSVLRSESLLNDAASIVSFQFAIAAATTGQFSALQFTWNIAYSFLGGAVLGAVLGFLMNSLMLTLRRLSLETTTTRITIELLFPLFAYVLAENIHVSGVITVVAAGLLLRYNRMGVGSDIARTNLVSDSVWKFVTFALNGSVFVLLGIELPLAMRDSLGSPPGQHTYAPARYRGDHRYTTPRPLPVVYRAADVKPQCTDWYADGDISPYAKVCQISPYHDFWRRKRDYLPDPGIFAAGNPGDCEYVPYPRHPPFHCGRIYNPFAHPGEYHPSHPRTERHDRRGKRHGAGKYCHA